MKFTTLFFDLDDTLYPPGSGLWDAIRDRMSIYMEERLGISQEAIPILRRAYYETYGTTLRGLQANYEVDPEDYLAFVHDLPLRNYLQPDLGLRGLILSLPQRKWIFTNADTAHAERVIKVLHLEDCFDGIVDVRAIEYACKPMEEAYQKALALAGNVAPGNSVLFEDSRRNLVPARALGLYTVLVGKKEPDPAAQLCISSLSTLPVVMPELWEEKCG